MDGVDQLNNVLIIGMTNRLDMIDEALLRPGRLEVHIEISLPDEGGRFQILNIHTSKMRNNGVMASDVDLAELASLTKNFSGAELGGLVKSATSFAFNRHVKVGSVAAYNDVENLQISRVDFMHALDEVQPAFGVAEEELQQVVQNGIIHFDQRINVSGPLSRQADIRKFFRVVVFSSNKCANPAVRLSCRPYFTVPAVLARRLWQPPLPLRPTFPS